MDLEIYWIMTFGLIILGCNGHGLFINFIIMDTVINSKQNGYLTGVLSYLLKAIC